MTRNRDDVLATAYRYFLAVAEAGSMRAASRDLNIASSAVNRQILLLEDAIGMRLFERTGKPDICCSGMCKKQPSAMVRC